MNRLGFTLTELMITIVISTIAFFLIYPVFSEINHSINDGYTRDKLEEQMSHIYCDIDTVFSISDTIIFDKNVYVSASDTVKYVKESRNLWVNLKSYDSVEEFYIEKRRDGFKGSTFYLMMKSGKLVREIKWNTPIQFRTQKEKELIWD